MSQTLVEFHNMLQLAIENSDRISYSLEPCLSEYAVLNNKEEIIPLWQLKKERQRRGTGVPVDLGLSVLWSSRNIGAPTGDKPGYYVGWADASGQKTSTRNEDYPFGSTPSAIEGSEYDIAHALWAEAWRIPTRAEMLELIQNCQWYWTVINGVPGYQIVGRTGNSIFLPAAGSRYGSEYEDAYSYGRYWTSELSEKNPAKASLLEFSQQEREMISLARCTGMNIRPVIKKKG